MRKMMIVPVAALLLGGASLLMGATPVGPNTVSATQAHQVALGDVDIAKPMKKCAACHGKDFGGKKKAPNIAGWPVAKVKKSLTTNIPKSMKAVTKKLTPEQIDAISAAVAKMPKVEKKAE